MVNEAHDLSNHECLDTKWNFTERHVQIAVFNDFADSMNADWDKSDERMRLLGSQLLREWVTEGHVMAPLAPGL